MTALGLQDFPAFFRDVHGYDPFPWQARLAKQVLETGKWPSLLDLPTGAGKTAAIDIAVFHLACEAGQGPERRAPLRILFVIDRRIVVDEASRRAGKIAAALIKPKSDVLALVAEQLRRLAGDVRSPLAVVRLRGGAPQERDWARSPAQPLVAVSTVDQVGSRLLFRGYGVGSRMRPVHAGLVGADTLWILDEVHLSQPFWQTLEAIVIGHPEEGTRGILADEPRLAPFGVVRLSATPGERPNDTFFLAPEDHAHPKLEPRLAARKLANLAAIEERPEAAFCNEALKLAGFVSNSPAKSRGGKKAQAAPVRPLSRIAVVVNRVDLARGIFKEFVDHYNDKVKAMLLTGRVRPLDSDRILCELAPLFAKPDRDVPPQPIVLVATQTIEAGADLDVDALITEIAPLDSMRQRFGRLDRLGERRVSRAVILHPKGKPGRENDWAAIGRIYGEAAFATKEWLTGLHKELDFGIDGFAPELRALESAPDELKKLLANRADAPILLPAYVDLWAMTEPEPAATPEPSLFLHGPRTSNDVEIVWRADIDLDDIAAAKISLDLSPPSPLEAIPVPAWAVRRWLAEERSAPFADVSERLPDEDEAEPGKPCLRFDARENSWSRAGSKALEAGDRIVVPCSYGGCDRWGWNPASRDSVSDLGAQAHYFQRLKGALRVTRATLESALRSEDREAEVEDVWREIRQILPEEGDDEVLPVTAVIDDLLALSLPSIWLRLIQSSGGIRDRRPVLGSYREGDWSRGFILYSEKRLNRDILPLEDGEDEPEGEEAITGRQDSSRIGVRILLDDHLKHVAEKAYGFANRAGLPDWLVDLVTLAARLHDVGKADPRFQADLHSESALVLLGLPPQNRDLLAKSKRGEGRRGGTRAVPEDFRHEALSVSLAEQHPDVRKLSGEEQDLVLWLIGTHHGYGRPFFPPCADSAPEMQIAVDVDSARLAACASDTPLRLDQGWFERASRVRRRFGPWELARLEAILRLADHAASADEQEQGDNEQATAAHLERVS